MQTTPSASLPLPLLYAGPVLLNGLLTLAWWYIKKKNSPYTQIAQGLEFLLGLLLATFVLNLGASIWAFTQGYHLLGAAYLVVMGPLAYFFATRFYK